MNDKRVGHRSENNRVQSRRFYPEDNIKNPLKKLDVTLQQFLTNLKNYNTMSDDEDTENYNIKENTIKLSINNSNINDLSTELINNIDHFIDQNSLNNTNSFGKEKRLFTEQTNFHHKTNKILITTPNKNNIYLKKEKSPINNNKNKIYIDINELNFLKETIKNLKNENNENKKDILDLINNNKKYSNIILSNISKRENKIKTFYLNQINEIQKAVNTYEYKIKELINLNDSKNNDLSQKLQIVLLEKEKEISDIKFHYEKIIFNLQNDLNSVNQKKKYLLTQIKELNTKAKNIENLTKEKNLLNEKNQQLEKLNLDNEKNIQILNEQIKNLKIENLEYSKEIENFKTIMRDVKISLKANIENEKKISELKKEVSNYKIKNQEIMTNKNNLIIEMDKLKKKNIYYTKENRRTRSFLDKYKTYNSSLSKEKTETIKHIEKLNREISDLKKDKINQLNRIKNDCLNKSNNTAIIESNHKLKFDMDELSKEKKILEEKYDDLLKSVELKKKTDRKNRSILRKKKVIKKFDILNKNNCISFSVLKNKKKIINVNLKNAMKDYEEKINMFNGKMNKLCDRKNDRDYSEIKKELVNLKYENQKLFECIENKTQRNNNFRKDIIYKENSFNTKLNNEKELKKIINCVKKLIRISLSGDNNTNQKFSGEEYNIIKELKDIMINYEKNKGK